MKIVVYDKLVYIQEAEKDILKQIDNLLSYKIDGAFFSPAYRMGRWDGKNHLFNNRTKSFSIGLLYRLLSYLDSEKIEYEIEDKSEFKTNFKQEYLNGYNDFKLREYQKESINKYLDKYWNLTNRRGIFNLPPRSGKTLLSGFLGLVLNEYPLMFVVHKIDLAYQTKKVFDKLFGFECGIVGDGQFNIDSSIVISTIQSISKTYDIKLKKDDELDYGIEQDIPNKDKFKIFISKVKTLIGDECFTKDTKIMVTKNKFATIKEIYDNKFIDSVLSYNEENKILEEKKIIRKIKNEKKVITYRIDYKVGDKTKVLRCTDNHKIWTNNGYKQAKDLKKGDIIKYIENFDTAKKIYICSKCGEIKTCQGQLGGHITSKHSNSDGICEICNKYYKQLNNHKNYHKDPDRAKRIAKTKDYSYIEKMKSSTKYKETMRLMGEKRKGKNNPVFNHPDTIEKIRKKGRERFQKLTEEEKIKQIIRFKNAPKYKGKMTFPEKTINGLKFNDLVYNGDGMYNNSKYIYKLRRYKDEEHIHNKIPDFIVLNQNKVIEIADREYWHTEEEMNWIKNEYERIGIKCLILYDDEIRKNLEECKIKLETFINNHDGEVIGIKRSAKYAYTTYNLEIEDNHNYFADGVLVSNCHISSSDTFQALIKELQNVKFMIGLSGTPYREDKSDMLIENMFGSIIYTYPRENAVKEGFVLPIKSYFIHLPEIRVSKTDVQTMKREAVNENDYIIEGVVKLVKRMEKKGMSSVIMVRELSQGDKIHERLKCVYLNGKVSGKEREIAYKRLERKEILTIISTVTDIGVDIPTLDCVIVAGITKSKTLALQRVRCGTPDGKKTHGRIFVFCPKISNDINKEKKYVENWWKTTMRHYKKEDTFTVKEMDYKEL